MAALNYATQYQQALEQEFPYVLYFGALFSTRTMAATDGSTLR